MKKVYLAIMLFLLLFVFVNINKVEATPPKGISIEICKNGFFQRLLGNCFEYEVEASYSTSSIWCRTSNFSQGWVCTDSNGEIFDINYRAVNIKNITPVNLEIVRFRTEYGRPWSYSDIVQSQKSIFIFQEEDHEFSIRFD